MHDVSCFVCYASFCMPYVMLLRLMFYGMLDASYPMYFMSYRVEASTIADIVEMRFQERSMKADHYVVWYCSTLYRIVLCSRHVLRIMFHASCFMPHFELHASCFVPHAALLRVMLHVMLCAS